jgi:hypothetical protein
MAERVLPESVDYTKILPLAVESRSRRRTYLPTNGNSFVSDANNIIRIDVSANAFLDTKHSYLRFRMRNTTGQAFGPDFGGGQGFIERLVISQQGDILSDCQHYNRLLSSILLPAQASTSAQAERSITECQRWCNEAGTQGAAGVDFTDEAPNAECGGAAIVSPTNSVIIANGQEFIFSIPLVNGLLGTTQDKMVPLQLLGASPLTIEITLAPADDVGVFGAAPASYTIDEVRYIASLVEVGPDVDAHIREVQAMSGGRLVLNGVDYTHFNGQLPAGAQGEQAINIPCRRKSIKSLLWSATSRTYAGPVKSACYSLSFGGHLNMRDWYIKAGNVKYPPVPISCRFDGPAVSANSQKAECFDELTKCFGTLHSAHGTGILNRINTYTTDCDNANMPLDTTAAGGGASNRTYRFSPFGIDCEAFQRTAAESGIDTASRSLPMTLNVKLGVDAGGAAAGEAIAVDAYVVYDSLYFIDQAGRINVSM